MGTTFGQMVRAYLDPTTPLIRVVESDGGSEEVTLEQYIRRLIREEVTIAIPSAGNSLRGDADDR